MNEALRSVVNQPTRWSLDEATVASLTPSAPGRDGFRLCRAIVLVALGAAMHLPLPNVTPSDIPLIMPLQFVHATAWRLERRVIVEQSIVFARRLQQLNSNVPNERSVARLADATSGPLKPYPQLSDIRLAFSPADAVPTSTSQDSGPTTELNSTPDPPVIIVMPENAPTPAVATNASAAPDIIPVEDLRRVKTALAAQEHLPSEALVVGTRRLSEEELVRRLIDEYTGALERLDVGAAQAVFPTVDGKALKKAFGGLSAQRLTLQACGITISGSTANARCRGSASYQPRIGTRAMQLPSREWTFDLSKQDTDWRIVNTLVR